MTMFCAMNAASDVYTAKTNPDCDLLSSHAMHQTSPLLGCAQRIGEATNPGPKHRKERPCLLNVVLANPTSVSQKKQTFDKLLRAENVQILCLSETAATKEVQQTCQKELATMHYKCFWSNPVPPKEFA